MSEHTLLPWEADYHEGIIFLPRDTWGDRVNICSVYPFKRQENMEFIVRAVNAHDELVAACQEMLAHLKFGGVYKEEVYADLVTRAEKALDAAKGDNP